jgi:Ser/Thr protein kinase RdoA (MazF antagonist)
LGLSLCDGLAEDELDLAVDAAEFVARPLFEKGVIHRDIKPGNVLVSVWEGSPIPKVIDFGVAKAISQILTEKTIFTEQGMIIGTP